MLFARNVVDFLRQVQRHLARARHAPPRHLPRHRCLKPALSGQLGFEPVADGSRGRCAVGCTPPPPPPPPPPPGSVASGHGRRDNADECGVNGPPPMQQMPAAQPPRQGLRDSSANADSPGNAARVVTPLNCNRPAPRRHLGGGMRAADLCPQLFGIEQLPHRSEAAPVEI
ncbi:unnamed protein product, partial [Iphiclides podalirius]